MAASLNLFVSTLFLMLMAMTAEATRPSYINYTTITGYFLQDEPSTDPRTFNYVRFMNQRLLTTDGID